MPSKIFPLIFDVACSMIFLEAEMKNISKNMAMLAFGSLLFSVPPVSAQGTNFSYSDVVGYVKTTLLAGSDTVIAPQVLRPSEMSAPVTSVSTNSTQATLTVSGVSMTANQFQFNDATQPKTYFALVTAGNLRGTYFLVSSNSTSALTVNLDGLNVSTADITAIEVRPCWTLGTLFPLTDANVSFVPSASQAANARRTLIIFPNLTGTGINRAAAATYFFNNTTGIQDWVSTTSLTTKAGNTPIYPGTYAILRNTGGTPANLTLTHSGSLLAWPLATYLGTATNSPNDTYLALSRATDYTLAELGLTDAAFTPSLSTAASGRRDQLLVIAGGAAGVNRASSATYFRVGTNWYSTTATTVITNNAVIPAGSALVVRKVVSDGNDRVWVNNLNVSLGN